MAFATNLLAISWDAGQYEIVSQTVADVDLQALEQAGLLHNASYDVGYMDEAAIVQRADFAKYLLPPSNPWHKAAAAWLASLPSKVMFIVVHRAEWESGLSD